MGDGAEAIRGERSSQRRLVETQNHSLSVAPTHRPWRSGYLPVPHDQAFPVPTYFVEDEIGCATGAPGGRSVIGLPHSGHADDTTPNRT